MSNVVASSRGVPTSTGGTVVTPPAPSIERAAPSEVPSTFELAGARLRNRGIDPTQVLQQVTATQGVTVADLYRTLGVAAATEKAGQSPTFAMARLALASGLPQEIADTLYLAYTQQSAEEAGHGDKVFGNAYYLMGGSAPSPAMSVIGHGDAPHLEPKSDPQANLMQLCMAAASIGGIETVALSQIIPAIENLGQAWQHPVGQDLARQIREIVRPEESRHVLTWRYVFHAIVAPLGQQATDLFFQATNAARTQLGAPPLDRPALERLAGKNTPTLRQLLGKDRVLFGQPPETKGP